MTRHVVRDQRGSISVLYLGLFTTVLLLLIGFVEREWVNYSIRLAEQTADFAAEAAVQNSRVLDTIRVPRKQRYFTYRTECELTDPVTAECLISRQFPEEHFRYDWVSLPPTEREELKAKWQAMAECGQNPDAPKWECLEFEVTAPAEVEFPDAAAVAGSTFAANWEDRAAASVLEITVVPQPAKRQVEVQVILELRSLFGVGWGPLFHEVRGTAVTQTRKLVLTR